MTADFDLVDGFDYLLFGLHFRSEFRLPELVPTALGPDPNVVIRKGNVPAIPDGLWGPQAVEGRVVFDVKDVARFSVAEGSEIVVDAYVGAASRNVRLYLLGSVIGILLHQRGLLPLHANAVEIDGKAVAFMGPSGAGKSTLAVWFHDHDFPVIADDVCAVGFDDQGRPITSPGLARVRLWKDALAASGRESDSYPLSFANDEGWEKYDVPLGVPASGGDRILAALYVLEKGEEPEFVELTAARAAEAVFANTYRGQYLAVAGDMKAHWESSLRLIAKCPVFRVSRPWSLENFDAVASLLAEHAKSAAKNAEIRTETEDWLNMR